MGIDYDEELENLNNIRSQIWQELGDYYKAKYGFDMKKDIFILYDLDKQGFKQAIIDFVASKGIEATSLEDETKQSLCPQIRALYEPLYASATVNGCINVSPRILR